MNDYELKSKNDDVGVSKCARHMFEHAKTGLCDIN